MAGAAVPHAVWTPGDEDKLLDFLLEHRAAAGDGGNFKEATFQGISGLLTPLVTKGGPKTVRACQNKWNSVRYHIPIIQLCVDSFLKLRRTFRVVQGIKNVSGWTWSDETGASITPELESSWAAYVRIHKDAKPFKHKGWRHLHKMELVMPATIRGAYVFRASDSTVGVHPQPAAAEEDEDPDAAPPVYVHPPSYDASQVSNETERAFGSSQGASDGTQITWVETQATLEGTHEDTAASPEDDVVASSQGSQGANAISAGADSGDDEGDEIQVTQVSNFSVINLI